MLRNIVRNRNLGRSSRQISFFNLSASKDDETKKADFKPDIGPMVPGRKRSKPLKHDTEEKSAFSFPRWEMKYVDSIDIMGKYMQFSVTTSTLILDTLGTNIRIGSRFNNIVDIRACDNEDVNKEFASDKARFSYDGLTKKRLSEPMVRDASGNLVPYGWDEVLQSKFISKGDSLFCFSLWRCFD